MLVTGWPWDWSEWCSTLVTLLTWSPEKVGPLPPPQQSSFKGQQYLEIILNVISTISQQQQENTSTQLIKCQNCFCVPFPRLVYCLTLNVKRCLETFMIWFRIWFELLMLKYLVLWQLVQIETLSEVSGGHGWQSVSTRATAPWSQCWGLVHFLTQWEEQSLISANQLEIQLLRDNQHIIISHHTILCSRDL